MWKKEQKKLHRWLCVLACFSLTISDQLQALITSDSYVITCNRVAGWFDRTAGMRMFSRMLVTWYCFNKGFLCNVEQYA
jgi:hypothetical protein